MKAKFLVPLALFFVLVGFLAIGLKLNPREVPSPLIDKPAPAFSLARVDDPTQRFGLADMRGKVWLLNVWSSWCVACREEHPVLVEFARSKAVPLVGLDYKEVRGDGGIDASRLSPEGEAKLAVERARGWLGEHGNPYHVSVMDLDGRVGIDFGVYGVPETFLIDQAGVIRYKVIGPLTPDTIRDELLPRIAQLQRGR